jgi:RNA polymerase sigma-70 factor (ECF subfamily)
MVELDSLPTRHSLLNRLKDWDDRTSWQEFFDTYWRLIYNVGRQAGLTDAEAQDVVQETVIRVAKKIGEFEADPARGSFKAWLLQQTRWRIADQLRRRGKAGETSPRPGAGRMSDLRSDASGTATVDRVPDPAGPDLDRAWDDEWREHASRTALERLKARVSARQYQMFDLHVLQGLSVLETARSLGVSVASVYMAKYRLSRLLQRETARLEREGR